jgi:hypothetical protein
MRRALVLVPAGLSMLAICGCRREPSPPPPGSRGSVRVELLLNLHPAWNDVVELDRLIAHLTALPAALPASSIPLPGVQFPAPVKDGIAAPATAQPPQAGSRSAAEARIKRLRDTLEDHSERVTDRERAAMEKRLAADVAVERARVRDLPRPAMSARNAEDERALRKLQFQAIALESQVRVLFGDALKTAQEQLDVVLAKIKELQAPPAVLEEVQDQEIEKQVSLFRTARRAELEKELK